MGKLNNIFEKSKSFSEYSDNYFDYLSSIFKKIDKEELEILLGILQTARDKGATIYFLGNGGSASTASHFANDFNKFASKGEKKFKALSLTDNISWVTALANDEGYENIFVRQLENLLGEDDVVVGISASGNSMNILKAFEYANNKKAKIVAVVGFDGGKIKKIANHSVHVPTENGEYGPVEDIHMILDHILSSYIAFLSERADKK